jgi:hypothetical protein
MNSTKKISQEWNSLEKKAAKFSKSIWTIDYSLVSCYKFEEGEKKRKFGQLEKESTCHFLRFLNVTKDSATVDFQVTFWPHYVTLKEGQSVVLYTEMVIYRHHGNYIKDNLQLSI